MKYRMYVDEVGNPDIENSENPNHRFLSLTGVIFELDYIKIVVNPLLEKLKTKFFDSHPDEPIILHRKEIVNAAPPFSNLKKAEIRKQFDIDILNLLKHLDYIVITVCLDKKNHKETYRTWRYDPYHYCMAVLLERYIYFLERIQIKGDVLAESRGGKPDIRLKDSFKRLWENGTEYVEPDRFQNSLTSRELKVKPKIANISGLQITDLIAHPSRNEILNENGFKNMKISSFAMEIIDILKEKYDCKDEKVYGKKFI